MAEKKSFFELLDAKNALLVGVVGGVLALGTLGFIILGVLALKGRLPLSAAPSLGYPVAAAPSGDAPAQAVPPPPANIPKSQRPKVELFVMSYCPFGLQMEKAYAPAWRNHPRSKSKRAMSGRRKEFLWIRVN